MVADIPALDQWMTQPSRGVNFDIVADPQGSLAPGGGVHLPVQYVVDPKTMRIQSQSQPTGEWVCNTRLGLSPVSG
jgi:hypothetical protein